MQHNDLLSELLTAADSGDNKTTTALKKHLLEDRRIQDILTQVSSWPDAALERHNDADHVLHKVVFLADIGFKADDVEIAPVIEKIFNAQSNEGAFRVLMNVNPRYGGSGQDQLVWMLCDSPSIIYALARMGLSEDKRVKKSAEYLFSLSSGDGWRCTVSPEMGNFRGPGRKTDICPYATLISLKALSQFHEYRDSAVCKNGAEALLSLWQQRKEKRPYLFAMGTHFQNLKLPFIWYDILHVLDVLTVFPWLRGDKRLIEMAGIIERKSDTKGMYTSESVWKAWSEWDFGQKKQASSYLTFRVRKILERLNG